MDNLLSNQTAVVTGAASGLGRAISKKFAQEGADIVVADTQQQPRLKETPTHELIHSSTESRATYVDTNVTSSEDLEAAITAADEFGGLDIMVNNAGVLGPTDPVTELSYEDYRELMQINLDGVFRGSKAAAEKLTQQAGGGVIINMSSLAGLLGYAGILPYATAKAGVRNMTYVLANELGPNGIRVNAIHPGEIETALTTEDIPVMGTEQGEQIKQQIPLRQFGEPADIANAAVFLASDMAKHITAESLVVDGGYFNTP
jgi:NAD(P)-dependent dehydrogenase (short-subunit alcohol dehydrogenase family)